MTLPKSDLSAQQFHPNISSLCTLLLLNSSRQRAHFWVNHSIDLHLQYAPDAVILRLRCGETALYGCEAMPPDGTWPWARARCPTGKFNSDQNTAQRFRTTHAGVAAPGRSWRQAIHLQWIPRNGGGSDGLVIRFWASTLQQMSARAKTAWRRATFC
jgi:hypothetical protein